CGRGWRTRSTGSAISDADAGRTQGRCGHPGGDGGGSAAAPADAGRARHSGDVLHHVRPGQLRQGDAAHLPAGLRRQDGADARGTAPFLPVMGNYAGQTPQIPTTLPTLDEILGTPDLGVTSPEEYLLARVSGEKLNVFTLHAEAEGMGNAEFFVRFLDGLRA